MLSLRGISNPQCAQATIFSAFRGGAERSPGPLARFFQTHQINPTKAMSSRYFILGDSGLSDTHRSSRVAGVTHFEHAIPAPRKVLKGTPIQAWRWRIIVADSALGQS